MIGKQLSCSAQSAPRKAVGLVHNLVLRELTHKARHAIEVDYQQESSNTDKEKIMEHQEVIK